MSEQFPATKRTSYVETFDDGPGGWLCWSKPATDFEPEIRDGVLQTRSPWGVDPNHAPPGAGYLTLLATLLTRADRLRKDMGRPNRFIEGGYSRDLTNARLTVRLRGEVDLKGSQMILLVQADASGTTPNMVLTAQPFEITREWSEQTITLVPDSAQWVCLGGRHNAPHYGYGPIDEVLRDVNLDIIFILFPLMIVPTTPVDDIHFGRPHRDYEADQAYLPQGWLEIDTVRIDYPETR